MFCNVLFSSGLMILVLPIYCINYVDSFHILRKHFTCHVIFLYLQKGMCDFPSQIAAVCDFYAYIRYIIQGLVKSSGLNNVVSLHSLYIICKYVFVSWEKNNPHFLLKEVICISICI